MRRFSPLALALLIGCSNTYPDRTPLAPPFEAESSKGGVLKQLELSQDKDILIVFVSTDGAVGKQGLRIAKAIEDRLGSKVITAIGAVSESPDQIKEWGTGSPIPVISDTGARIAMRYKAQISPTFQLIGKGGTWGRKVEGCDAKSMSELEKLLDLEAGALKDLASKEASDKRHIW